LRKLIDRFEAAKSATENWRFAAHRQVKFGDHVYLLKQGDPPRGIFAIGKVTDLPIRDPSPRPNERDWRVPITFYVMVDPTTGFLATERELQALPVPRHRWRTQSSGVSLEAEAARAIDRLASGAQWVRAEEASTDPFDPRSLEDAREKIRRAIVVRRGQRAFREELLKAYGGRCALTGCDLVDLLEAAHIVPYKGVDTNDVRNGLLLRADIHTLFDCGLLAIDSKAMKVVLASKVKRSSYRKLVGRKLRLPTDQSKWPSKAALDQHRSDAFGDRSFST
jgi:hypothetical protein